MRFVVALLVGIILGSAGCDDPLVKNDFMSLDELQKTKKFLAYEVVIGPGLVEPYEKDAEEDGHKINTELVEMQGPFRLSNEVNADIRMETRNPFHRRVKVDGKYHEFKLTDDVIGFGYRLVSVRNKNDEFGILVLKTKNKVPSWNVNAEEGVLLTENEKKEREREKNAAKDEENENEESADEKSAEQKSDDDKSGDDKSGDEKADEGAGEKSDDDKSSDK